MTQHVRCQTFFDITTTGVRNHFSRARLPFQDEAGHTIQDEKTWHRSRNKQRNWETINAVMSLRTLPIDITQPAMISMQGRRCWQFTFVIEQPGALEIDENPVSALLQDCQGVPMHIGLDEEPGLQPCMITQGPDANTFFSVYEA